MNDLAKHPPRSHDAVHTQTSNKIQRLPELGDRQLHCAYNRTRECFLGLAVVAVDLSDSPIEKLIAEVVVSNHEGLWLVPYRDIPAFAADTLVDLIYLDQNCRVLGLVCSYSANHVASGLTHVSSTIVLPPDSISSSETQLGDQLIICLAGEMKEQLSQNSGFGLAADQSDRTSTRSVEVTLGSAAAKANVKGSKHLLARTMRSLWRRICFADKRNESRTSPQSLEVFYWTGGISEAHQVRDISDSGMYVITKERWYPGTLVLMTLQAPEIDDLPSKITISVQARAVRWGEDGVGLRLVLPDHTGAGRGLLSEGADKSQFEQFRRRLLALAKKSK